MVARKIARSNNNGRTFTRVQPARRRQIVVSARKQSRGVRVRVPCGEKRGLSVRRSTSRLCKIVPVDSDPEIKTEFDVPASALFCGGRGGDVFPRSVYFPSSSSSLSVLFLFQSLRRRNDRKPKKARVGRWVAIGRKTLVSVNKSHNSCRPLPRKYRINILQFKWRPLHRTTAFRFEQFQINVV